MMKKIVLATALVALGSASAFAADLPARGMVAKAPTMAPVNAWQGLYIGGNVGYGWGNGGTNFTFLPTETRFEAENTVLNTEPRGVIGGAQIGYNWQMGSLVAGLEADIQGSGVKGDSTKLGTFLSSSEKLPWFGTVRGRLGVTVNPDLLVYATGGLAYGQIDASANTFFDSVTQYPASVSKTKVGWTAGAGVEWMFARNWSTKIEYLYVDLGEVSATAQKFPEPAPPLAANYIWHTQQNIVRAGVNYHF